MAEPPTGRAYLRLILLGAAIGIPAALVAALFIASVHGLEHWLWGPGEPPWYAVLSLPVLGAIIVVLARRFLPGDGGHSPLKGLSTAATPISHAPGVFLAALGSLSYGAVLGPEAPVIALGSVVGMVANRYAKFDTQGASVISNAGQFSAISALFGGPLVAGMLLLEGGIGLGARLLPVLLPGLVAAAIGYLIFVGFGTWGGLDAPGLEVPDLPAYTGVHLGDLLIVVVVGVLSSFALARVHRLGTRVSEMKLPMPALLLAGGLAVGLLALLARALGANSQDVLFSGQTSVGVVATADSTKIVLVLLIAKFLAYAVCLGCGFRGGPIFPAIFLGVAIASLGVVWFDLSPTLALAGGAAAGMAAQTRLIFSPLLFAGLLVGASSLDVLPPAVLAVAAAWLTTKFLDRRAKPTVETVAPAD
ncbi:H+/Cl- antiporter ClcA [Hamadaea flava]|uniref:Chloride channel protein n=1 Tax=Hamadaea flava TaxID=1742688 RepID=A0ABV8LKB0_9ACTN|nr:chloride channel protein [Hamadaea flava]MCP2323869.1 H+/Cl- antiporter ClcA [Hamadaea flava]